MVNWSYCRLDFLRNQPRGGARVWLGFSSFTWGQIISFTFRPLIDSIDAVTHEPRKKALVYSRSKGTFAARSFARRTVTSKVDRKKMEEKIGSLESKTSGEGIVERRTTVLRRKFVRLALPSSDRRSSLGNSLVVWTLDDNFPSLAMRGTLYGTKHQSGVEIKGKEKRAIEISQFYSFHFIY